MERNLHHEVRGTGEPLLLVYGTGSSLRVWDPVVERLAASRTVSAVDLPGYLTDLWDEGLAWVAKVQIAQIREDERLHRLRIRFTFEKG